MLSAAKHLAVPRARPFAELTLSATNGLRVTVRDFSNCQGLFFAIEPCIINTLSVLFAIVDRYNFAVFLQASLASCSCRMLDLANLYLH
jgi:hypothetical protein